MVLKVASIVNLMSFIREIQNGKFAAIFLNHLIIFLHGLDVVGVVTKDFKTPIHLISKGRGKPEEFEFLTKNSKIYANPAQDFSGDYVPIE